MERSIVAQEPGSLIGIIVQLIQVQLEQAQNLAWTAAGYLQDGVALRG